jgi:hypothetical protein
LKTINKQALQNRHAIKKPLRNARKLIVAQEAENESLVWINYRTYFVHVFDAVREGRKGSGVNLREQVIGQISIENEQRILSFDTRFPLLLASNLGITHMHIEQPFSVQYELFQRVKQFKEARKTAERGSSYLSEEIVRQNPVRNERLF